MTPAAHAQAIGSAAALRSVYPSELGVDDLGGVTFDAAGHRLIVSNRRAERIASIDAVGDSFAEVPLPGLPAPATLSVDPKGRRLAAVAGTNVVSTPRGGGSASAQPLLHAVDRLVAAEFDAATGRWFALTRGGTAMEVFDGAPDVVAAAPTIVELRGIGRGTFRAIAPNPADGLIYLLGDQLYAIDAGGTLRRTIELSRAQLRAPTDMVFAPSADTTDPATEHSLYVVDRAEAADRTRLVEVTLAPLAVTADETSTLVATRNLFQLTTPSPDSAGIVYLPNQDRLVVSDSEVEEMSIFQGVNLFKITRSGTLTDTGVTTAASDEPTGVGFDQATNTLFVSDDDDDEIYKFLPGPDGRHGTGDDVISSFDTRTFGNTDAEDVAFDSDHNNLFIIDGVNREVYRVQPNANGFNGVPARGGDDTVTQFDVGVYGATDPEGIAYDGATDHLLVLDHSPRVVYEVTIDGALVRTIDVAAAAPSEKLAGITLAPGSGGGGGTNMYLVDRGVDNDGSPNENDGRMFEMTLPGAGPSNQAPVVSAGVDQTVTLPAGVTLDGTVSDDGLPNPPAAVTTTWSVVGGPGTVSFGNASAVDTTATFSTAGTYVLRLTANDSALATSDDIQVTVASAGGTVTVDLAVSASADDAEQNNTTGSVNLTNGDLELGLDGTTPQTVGVRFLGASLADGAVIQNAYLQFAADETNSAAVALTVEGHDADNAATFTTAASNISSRPRTTAAVPWSPPPWTVIGEAGANQRTPNLAGVVQEIIDRPGWVSGNPLAFIVTGTGRRTAEAFESGAAIAPKLHIEYTIGGTPPNQAPVVSAGVDQTVTLPAGVTLDGTVSDDGLPNPPAAVTTTWSVVGGPGTVSFGNASAVDTTATFSTAGTYVLRLTANDSALATSDDIQVTVASAGGTVTVDLAVGASADDAEQNNTTGSVNLTNGDLELGLDGTTPQTVGVRFLGASLADGAVIQNAYLQFAADETNSAAVALTVEGHDADNAATFTTAASNISSRPRTTAAVPWSPPPWTVIGEAGANQRTPNLAGVVQEIIDRPGWVSGNPLAFIVTGTGRRTAEAFESGAAIAPKLHIEYTIGGTPPNQAPVVSAGVDQTVTLPAGVTLDGTVSDDGLPNPPAAVTTTWSVVGGPGTVSFGNASAVDTTATFSTAGTYVLRLTANDSALATSDDIQVTAAPSGGLLVLDVAVSATNDDAEQASATGAMDLSSSDLELVADGSTVQLVGMRFGAVTIPQGAQILAAYLQFVTDETGSAATSLTVQGEAADTAGVFTTAASNISSRPRTTAAVPWSPPPWTVIGEAGANQRTPNLAGVIQEIVNRPGWASGNAVAVIITGTGRRTAEAFESGAAIAPELHIEYTLP